MNTSDPSLTVTELFTAITIVGYPIVIYFAKDNRINRQEFIVVFFVIVSLFFFGVFLSDHVNDIIGRLVTIVAIWITIFSIACRLNDRNSNRWLALWAGIPIIFMFQIVWGMCAKSISDNDKKS